MRMKVQHPTRWVAVAVLLALVVVALVAATRPTEQAAQVQSPLVGKAAPELTGTTLAGAPFSLTHEHGHYVYVNFFASWCPSCQSEQQALMDFAFHQGHAGARMVSVVFNDTVGDARRYVAQWGIQWPVVPDDGGAIANRFGVDAPPTTFLVDPEGRVVGAWDGPVTMSQLDRMLRAARRGELVTGGNGMTGG